MTDRILTWSQLIVAAILAMLSALGIVSVLALDSGYAFSFQGGIASFSLLPGLVISLVVNFLILRSHVPFPLSAVERVLLVLEYLVLVVVVLTHFIPEALLVAFASWAVVIPLAISIALVGIVRNVHLRGARATRG